MNSDNITLYRPFDTDIPEIWQIFLQAKAQMKNEGRKQWDNNYPLIENIMADISANRAYSLRQNKRIIAYCVIAINGEPEYENIDGKWISYDDYAVVHRLAVADCAKQKGVATKLMNLATEIVLSMGINSIKVDTNFDNKYMLKIFEKLDYKYCGIIHYPKGDRLAYEKILNLD